MIIPIFRAIWKQTSYMDMTENKSQSPSLPLAIMFQYISPYIQIADFWTYTEYQALYVFVDSYNIYQISLLAIVAKIGQGK